VARFKLVFACGSKEPTHFVFFVFALAERKNEER
jgi:hypothetical protein